MAYTIAFFGTKPYDEASFNEKNKEFGFELRFFKGHLNNRSSNPNSLFFSLKEAKNSDSNSDFSKVT